MPEDSPAAARSAGLVYVSDTTPGIRRRRHGSHWRYIAPNGAAISDPEVLLRIKSLAVPPAWTDVWICPSERGHIQATGRDARGRKQYRYHARWREQRDETKYHRLLAFAAALPALRRRTKADLALPGLPREKVLAAVAQLLEVTLVRIGNTEYARDNGSFGLTTMRDRHVDVSPSRLEFHFNGKSGKAHRITLRDRRLATVVKRCRDIPGQQLFQYLDDDGERQSIGSADVNAYLRETMGEEFTAKDFRTWSGTVLAMLALRAFEPPPNEAAGRRSLAAAVETVAEQLGNTPAVCRKCYIHPAVFDAFIDGSLARFAGHPAARGLRAEEADVVALLRRRKPSRATHR